MKIEKKLEISFEDLNFRSILVTSETRFEYQNPRYHLEDLN